MRRWKSWRRKAVIEKGTEGVVELKNKKFENFSF